MTDTITNLNAALTGRYTLDREVGQGGMATVYLARDERHRRNVAIKVLRPELASAIGSERFLREIEISAGLDHPHILPLYDSGEAGGFLFYVMPFVEGESLRDRLTREKQLPVDEAMQIVREVADALSYAHSRGVVHRDIKPANIMLAGNHARVADFGIARAVSAAGGDQLTQTGLAIGTPAYMSPEQAAGNPDIDGRSDLYSLACVLYELLGGEPPFTGPTAESLIHQHLTVEPPDVARLRPAVPAPVSAILTRALSKNPADRFSPAAQFASALRVDTSAGATTAARTGQVPASGPDPLRVAGAFVVVGAAVLALVRVLVSTIGLPSWVFPIAVLLMIIGLPVMVATSVAEQKRAAGGAGGFLTWRRSLLGGGAAFSLLAVGTGAFMVMRVAGVGPGATLMATGALEEQATVALADFENLTADSTHGSTVTELMRIGLSQSTAITLLEPRQITELLLLMRRDPADGFPTDVAIDAAEREGLGAVITGDIRPVGTTFLIAARVMSPGGDVLASAQETATDENELVDTVDRLSLSLRESIGESLRSIQRSPPLDRVTTGSMLALRRYSQGMSAWNQGDIPRSLERFRESVDADSTFAMAWRKMAIILSNNQQERTAQINAANRAYDHRDRLTEAERHKVTAAYHSVVTGNRDLQIQAYRAVLELHPNDVLSLNNLGVIYGQLRDLPRAAEHYGRALAVDPNLRLYYSNLASMLGRLEMWDSAQVILEVFRERFPDNPEMQIAFLLNRALQKDFSGARVLGDSLMQAQTGTVWWEALAFEWFGAVSAIQGKMGDAEDEWARAFNLTADQGLRGPYLERSARRAMIEATMLGDPTRGRRVLDDALDRFPYQDLHPLNRPYGLLAMAYAVADDVDRARAIIDEYRATPDADHAREAERIVSGAEGLIAFSEGRMEQALELLAVYDDGNECATCAYPWMARALESMGQRDSAMVMMEAFVEDPSYEIWYDAAHLAYGYRSLGEYYEETGNTDKAVTYYAHYVDLLEESDPEFQPLVQTAREALVRLGGDVGN